MSEAKHHVPVGYLWIDLETTGLDAKQDEILEMAWAYVPADEMWTDSAEAFAKRIKTRLFKPRDGVKHFDLFVAAMHARSGLLEELLTASASNSFPRPSEIFFADAEPPPWEQPKESRISLAGSSVHFDLGFLRSHETEFVKRYLSHRVLDVSAMTLMCRSLGMPTSVHEGAEPKHRAADDLVASYRIGLECIRWLDTDVRLGARR